MRSLCATDVQFWRPIPLQTAPTELPHWIIKKIVTHSFETEVSVKLKDHVCDVNAPCSALGEEMRVYVSLLAVCKSWRSIISEAVMNYCQMDVLRPSHTSSHHSLSDTAKFISLDSRYRGYNILEYDSEKSVLRAYDYGGPKGCHDKKKVVIKVSTVSDQHENEQIVYEWLGHAEISPRLHFAGSYPYRNYYGLVLDSLGPDLGRLKSLCHHERFTPKMTLATAIQTVRIYERLHAQGWLHTNAKPGNFAIGPDIPGQCNKIFVFDFEFSNRIEQVPRKGAACGGWNSRFKPVTWDLGLSPSRRDDMEGLGYVFIYLERGSHLWQERGGGDSYWRIKISTPTKKLFEGMDPVYVQYFDEIKALAWGEIPDYEGILRRFSEVWERKRYGGVPGEIDWWDELRLRKNTPP